MLRRYKAFEADCVNPTGGAETHEGLTIVEIANGRASAAACVAPTRLDDGYFDVVVVKNLLRIFILLLPAFMLDWHANGRARRAWFTSENRLCDAKSDDRQSGRQAAAADEAKYKNSPPYAIRMKAQSVKFFPKRIKKACSSFQ